MQAATGLLSRRGGEGWRLPSPRFPCSARSAPLTHPSTVAPRALECHSRSQHPSVASHDLHIHRKRRREGIRAHGDSGTALARLAPAPAWPAEACSVIGSSRPRLRQPLFAAPQLACGRWRHQALADAPSTHRTPPPRPGKHWAPFRHCIGVCHHPMPINTFGACPCSARIPRTAALVLMPSTSRSGFRAHMDDL